MTGEGGVRLMTVVAPHVINAEAGTTVIGPVRGPLVVVVIGDETDLHGMREVDLSLILCPLGVSITKGLSLTI